MRTSVFLAIAGLSSAISAFDLVGNEAREHARDIKLGSDAAILEARARDSAEKQKMSSEVQMGTYDLTIVVGVPKGPTSHTLDKAGSMVGGVVGDALHNVADLVQGLKERVQDQVVLSVPHKTFMDVVHPQTKSNSQYALCGVHDKPHDFADEKWKPCYKDFYCPKMDNLYILGGIYQYKGTSSATFCEQKCICFSAYHPWALGWGEPNMRFRGPGGDFPDQ